MKKFADFNESADFKPHLMYKDGKEQKANTHAMHLKLKADGWSHEKLDESYPLTLMDNITESSYSIKVSQAWKKVKSLPNVRGISNSGQSHAKKLSSLLKGSPDKLTFEKLELALGNYETHAYKATEDKKNPHGKEDLVKLEEFSNSVDDVIGAMKNLHQSQLPEALNMQQRMARGRQMKRNKSKLARGRLKASKRTASKDVLAKRARKAARSAILSKMTKGMSKSELSPARKRELEKKLEKPAFATKISRVAQKLLPKMRKTEIARRANRNKGSSN